MQTKDAITERRAVKLFDPTYVISQEEEDQLFELVKLAPTSFNIQHSRFVLVKDKALREEIKGYAWNQAQITDASILCIICGDVKAWEKSPERYWAKAPKEASDVLVPMIGQFYNGREQIQRDEVMRSTGISAQTLMLAAKSMGYDSCPMVGFDPVQVAKAINMPDDHIISMIVTVGKALQPAKARGGFIPKEEAIKVDRF